MSMNGMLREVSPELLARLHTDAAARDRLCAHFTMGGMDGSPAEVIDIALQEGLGALYRWVPRGFRLWLLGRALPSGPRAPDASEPAMPAPPTGPVDREAARAMLEEQGFDEEEIAEHLAMLDEDDDDDDEDDDDEGEDDDEDLPGLGASLSLDKDWHLVHAVLTGTSDEAPGPAGDAVLGGVEVGDDLGYGPLRLLAPAQADAVAAWLQAHGAARLKAADTRALSRDEELYGADWVNEGGTRDMLRLRIDALTTFYAGVASRGNGVALWLI